MFGIQWRVGRREDKDPFFSRKIICLLTLNDNLTICLMKWFKVLSDYELLRKGSLSLWRFILFQVELLVMKALSLGLVKGKVVSSFAVDE